MAEGDFEKTIKLNPGSIPQSEIDKTLKLNSGNTSLSDMDKTLKLNLGGISKSPNDTNKIKRLTSSEESLPAKILSILKQSVWIKAVIAGVLILGLLGATWYFVPGLLLKSALDLSLQGDHEKAAKQLRWAQSLFPLNKVKYITLMAKELRLSSDLEGAQAALEKVLAMDPNHSEAVREMGLTAKAQGRNAQAFEYLNRTYQTNPNDHEALALAAQLAFDLKDFKNAVPLYQAITKSGGSAQDFFNLGTVLKESGKIGDAIQAFQACLDKGGAAMGPGKIMASLYMEQGDFESTLKSCELAIQTFPDDMELANMLAQSALKLTEQAYSKKDWKKAAGLLERGLKNPSNGSAVLHYEAARVYVQLKNHSQALRHLKSALAANKTLKAKARKDGAFLALRKNPKFKKLIR